MVISGEENNSMFFILSFFVAKFYDEQISLL